MTIKEIARLAGVSISTVSKIVNHKDGDIAPQTRERVLKIVKEYHYAPYATARKKLNTAKSLLIGIILRSPRQMDAYINGMVEAAQLNGYSLITCISYDDHNVELKNIAALCNSSIDAVIWEPIDGRSEGCESHFTDLNIPVLYLGPQKEAGINLDFSLLGYEMARQLIDCGHSKIICLTQKGDRESEAVAEGFRRRLFDSHIPFRNSVVIYEEFTGLYDKICRHEITAVLCASFDICMEIYENLKIMQYRIPEDVSIISIRRGIRESGIYPGISTITVPFYEFGKYICTQAIQMCERGTASEMEFTANLFFNHTGTIGKPSISCCPRILVVGSINIDTYLQVDRLPEFGKTVTTTRYSVYPGGKGTNQAIGAARLGHRVSIIGKVGHDVDADTVYMSLKDNKIESSGVRRDTEAQTGHAYIYVQPDGDSMISILAGANAELTPKDIFDNRKLFENAGYLLIQTEVPLACVTEACRLAKAHNVKAILKPSALDSIDDELLSLIHIMVPNEAELNELCPKPPGLEKKAATLIKRGLLSVIVTLGSRGCFYMDAQRSQYFPAPHFTSVDHTGASDAFVSCLASYLLYGYSIDASIQIAAYAAGFSITQQGVMPALVDKNKLETSISRACPALLNQPAAK